MRSGPIVILAALSIAAGCTGSSGYTVVTDPVTSEPRAPAATAPDESAGTSSPSPATAPGGVPAAVPDGPAIVDGTANGLVLVLTGAEGGNTLVSYQADGTEVVTYSTGTVIWQPIWSPDGRRVAWAQTVDDENWQLVTAAVDGADPTTHALPGRPDYLTYDPTAARVLALTPSPSGFGLAIVDVEATDPAEADVIDLGVPYFSDFSPAGDRVIAHVGSELRIVDLAGDTQPIDGASSGHQTPVWHPSEEQVFFAVDTAAGNQLVSYDLAGEEGTVLATFGEFILFDLDPTGERLAVSAVGPVEEGGVNALRTAPSGTAPDSLGSGLWIIELSDGTTQRAGDRPTTAPIWDPTGSRFLARTALSGIARWEVYGVDGTRVATDAHDVDASLLPAYLPFWDQFARSQTPWSPDGEWFVHVGRAEAGDSGVWIHDATAGGPSSLLVEGDLAFWSPT